MRSMFEQFYPIKRIWAREEQGMLTDVQIAVLIIFFVFVSTYCLLKYKQTYHLSFMFEN